MTEHFVKSFPYQMKRIILNKMLFEPYEVKMNIAKLGKLRQLQKTSKFQISDVWLNPTLYGINLILQYLLHLGLGKSNPTSHQCEILHSLIFLSFWRRLSPSLRGNKQLEFQKTTFFLENLFCKFRCILPLPSPLLKYITRTL